MEITLETLETNTNSDLANKINTKKFSLQFLPEQLNSIKEQKTILYKEKKLKVTYLVDIVHNLLLKYYFKKDNTFNLSSTILKEKYGFMYNLYMSYLTEKEILIMVKNYKNGRNARIYKLNEDVINSKILRFKNDDKVLLKKYRKSISLVENKEELIYNIILPDIKKRLVNNLFDVDIDYKKSIYFLDGTIQDKDVYNRNKYSVESINDKHIFYHFDSYGRMHTNFTILKSFIRKNCITINGNEVVELDIKNSQPLFLCKLIREDSEFELDESEFELFKYLTHNGIFYQYILDNSNLTRKVDVKKLVYKVLFGKNYRNSSDDLFKSLFPNIYLFIKHYKTKNGNYKTLSHELQKLESNLIYNKIIKKLITICPDIKLVTIHDSIIFEKKYKDIVDIIFDQKIKQEFNHEDILSNY